MYLFPWPVFEMVLKEARERDRHNLFRSIYNVLEEVMKRCNWIAVEHTIEERRKEEDENKG
jgi:hypothetical protein